VDPHAIRFLQHALALARKGAGLASPNPLVGCVIVLEGRIVGEGFHQYEWRDHAEIVALKSAGSKARGATLYVTLEPCNHTGRTGPCTEAIIAEGVQRVVAIEGRVTNLRKAELIQRLLGISGVEFVCGDLEEIDLQRLGHFDAVFASGILYHLAKPWLLLRRLTTVAPKLFLWTHYCPSSATNTLLDSYYGCLYPEGGADDPLSGLSATSFWFTRASLFDALRDAGYSKIELVDEDTRHPKGPTITLTAE